MRATKSSGVATSARPFFDEAPPVFGLELPTRLPPGSTSVPVRFEPPPFSATLPGRFAADIELTVGTTSQLVSFLGTRVNPAVPALIDFGGVLEGSTATLPIDFPADAELSLSQHEAFSLVDGGVRFSWPDGGTTDRFGTFVTRLNARDRCQQTTTPVVATKSPVLVTAVLGSPALSPDVGVGSRGFLLVTNSTNTPLEFTATAPMPFHFEDGGVIARAGRLNVVQLVPATRIVVFEFMPTQYGPTRAEAVVRTSLPSLPELRVQLVGVTGGPDVEVVPNDLVLTLGTQPARSTVVIHNKGSPATAPGDLHFGSPPYLVEMIEGTRDAIVVETHDSVDAGLPSGSSVSWFVTVLPRSRHIEARVLILTDDYDEPAVPVHINTF